MSHDYKMVTWTPFKKRFDRWMLAGIALYLVVFIAVTATSQPAGETYGPCLLYTSPSPRDQRGSRMPSSA